MGFALVSHDSRYYPEFGMARLRALRSRRWADLVEWVNKLPGSDPHVMAFTRTFRHLIHSLNLNPALGHDPFCAVCASATLEAYPGSEEELIGLYHQNLKDVTAAIGAMRMRDRASKKTAAA